MQTDFSTFDSFINTTHHATIGAGECWDYINILWAHEGRRYWTYPPSDPSSTNHGVKWGWINLEARAANTFGNFVQVTNINDIKRGDIVIITQGEYGHAGYADEDYDGSGDLWQYSQNWNSRTVERDHIPMLTFAGAWRYIPWGGTPPTPPTPTSVKRTRFPWVLFTNKIRKRNMV